MMSPRGSVAGDDASGDCVKVTEIAGPSAVFAMKLWYPSISHVAPRGETARQGHFHQSEAVSRRSSPSGISTTRVKESSTQ